MHILIVSEHFHKRPSGPRSQILGLAKVLAELGHQTSLVGIAKHHENETLPGGGPAVLRGYWWKVVPVKYGRPRFYARHMARIHKTQPVDAVIAAGVNAGMAAEHFRQRAGVPWLLNPCSGLQHKPGTEKHAEAARVMELCDAFIGISGSHRNGWCRDTGVAPTDKHFAVHLGFESDHLQGDEEPLEGVPAGEPLILCMGMLRKVKGQDILLRALARIRDRPWHLVLGGDGPERENFEHLRDELGLTERVTFAGLVQGARWRWLYRHAAVFCLCPTYEEAFGLVFVEAQAAGLPVVTSDRGAIPEVVADGETAFVVPYAADAPKQVESGLADAIARLLDDPELRRRMGQAGRERAAAFTWRRTAEGYLKAVEFARAVAGR